MNIIIRIKRSRINWPYVGGLLVFLVAVGFLLVMSIKLLIDCFF